MTGFERVVPSTTPPKFQLVGERVTGVTPVPVRLAVWGLLKASSFTFSTAVRVPRAPGVKVTEIVHVPLGARLAPQLLVWEKSLAFVPVKMMLAIFSVAF